MNFETDSKKDKQPLAPDAYRRLTLSRPNRVSQILIVVFLIVISYALGYENGKKGLVFEPKAFKVINQKDLTKTVDYQLLWDAIKVVQDKYIEKSPTPDKILYGAVRGAVESFGDPYTAFFEPSTLETFKTDLAGQFDGIGAEIGKKENAIVVVAPLEGMPAQKAGVLAKDIIVEVNSQSTAGWSVEQAVSKIRGPRGTKVELKLFREGRQSPFDVAIVRDKIEIKSVKWEFKEVDKNGEHKQVAIIKLSKFGDDTKPLMEKAVNEILTKSVNGIILDLRNNPGGYLNTAVDLASFWLGRGKLVVKEERSTGNPLEYQASGDGRLASIPTLVLINGGSASASEILAGALQDYKIVKLFGEKSFGKGSVQELVDLRDGTAVKVTVAKWITPSGKNLNKEGLHPDVEVKMTEQDYTEAKDPQMEAALQQIINPK
ncbi:MAG: S41 family peptidase [Candidatus Doudnabacteria bacterium]|nr:S41 family peptidase [Candidatus Doudnabacteria bacterium]